jgi:hypothetical protein
MRTQMTLLALCFSVLLPTANNTVPPADSVVGPVTEAPKADAAPGRSNSTMTRAQESSAMPMAGQNNDHSAPLTSEKRASAR